MINRFAGKSTGRMNSAQQLIVLIAALLIAMLLSPLSAVYAKQVSLREKLNILRQTYPAAIAAIDARHIVLSDGSKLLIDDGKSKSHQEKLKNPDIEDTLAQIYPLAQCYQGDPQRSFDPGRIRHDAFLRHLYGRNKAEAQASLTAINWFGKRLPVTMRHGVDAALLKVRDELRKLPAQYNKFFVETAGTFNWRVIAGTERLSVHSFGAAIDINVKFADYWRWVGGKPDDVPAYSNKIPLEIVDIFERYRFIWGGKWYHFDTMHFEYRPELIAIGRLAAERGCSG